MIDLSRFSRDGGTRTGDGNGIAAIVEGVSYVDTATGFIGTGFFIGNSVCLRSWCGAVHFPESLASIRPATPAEAGRRVVESPHYRTRGTGI